MSNNKPMVKIKRRQDHLLSLWPPRLERVQSKRDTCCHTLDEFITVRCIVTHISTVKNKSISLNKILFLLMNHPKIENIPT